MKRKNTYTDELNKDLKSYKDSAEEFVKFCLPFLKRDEKHYQSLLEILPKTPIKDIDEFIKTVPVMISQITLREEQTDMVLKKLKQIVPENIITQSQEELIEKISGEFTFEQAMEFTQSVEVNLEPEKKRLEQIENSLKTLSKQEQDLFEYHRSLTLKLWVNFCINKPGQYQVSSMLYKSYYPQYLKRINALYEREEIPRSLIEYIENIPITGQEHQSPQTKQKNETPLTINTAPVFDKSEAFYEFFKKHIHSQHHIAFKKLLKGEKINPKILFLGNANQLADTFKKLHAERVITACSKEELKTWLILHFDYKGKSIEGTPIREKSIREVISGKGKPCKNPLIEIQKEADGSIKYISLKATEKNYKNRQV